MSTAEEPVKHGDIYQVSVLHLKKAENARGHLMEVQRVDDPTYPGFGQAYVTMTLPGVVKAWYRHKKQTDQIALICGSLLLALFDPREESPTQGTLQLIPMDDKTPRLALIPTGVWHGFQSLGPAPAYLLHLNAIPIDLANPDEERLPPDAPQIPHKWT